MIRRMPRTLALAVIIGIGIFNLYQAVIGWTLSDAGAYWNAAMRLRDGGDLYPVLASVEGSEIYRYAPWFAWLTVPVTYLPIQLAGALWSLVLLGASARAGTAGAPAGLAAGRPLRTDPGGHQRHWQRPSPGHRGLVWGVERRSGPIWVGSRRH